MFIKRIYLAILIQVLVINVLSEKVFSEEDIDSIIGYLLNGESLEIDQSNEVIDDSEPVLTSGIWKCGSCENLDEKRLIYSEINDVEADMLEDQSVDIQVAVTMSDMKCVTVHASSPGVVKRMAGACSGPSVTLTVLPARHFTLQVYGD